MGQIRLPDQRILHWTEWGEASGKPLLFCTGAGMSSLLGFGESSVSKFGLRVISVDRPGIGYSDPHPEKNLQTWTEDIRFLLQTLRSDSASVDVIGFSQGAPYALALAAAGLARRVALVSGQDDFSYAKTRDLLPDEIRTFVGRFQEQDHSFISEFAKSATAKALWTLIISMSSEVDREFYQNEPFCTSYLKSLEEGFRQGAAGYVRDLFATFNRWPFEIESIRNHIDLWYGGKDASAVHSPDFGETLAQRLPNCSRFFLADQGGSLLWTQTDKILSRLIK